MFNIVIVEDEPIELESLRRIISQCVENAVIHEASTGKKAIQLIDQLSQIDMIFVDINIPLPNGKQVIEYLKKKKTILRSSLLRPMTTLISYAAYTTSKWMIICSSR